jgi:glutaredoxin
MILDRAARAGKPAITRRTPSPNPEPAHAPQDHRRVPGNAMQIVLIVANDCPPCERAREVWERACQAVGMPLAVHDAESPDGLRLIAGRTLTTVPALLVDGRITAVGLQTPEQAREILSRHVTDKGGS